MSEAKGMDINMKRIIVLFLIFLLLTPLSVFAHPSHECFPGGEGFGYKVNCGEPFGHQSRTSYHYRFVSGTSSEWINLTRNAVTHWNNTGIVSISENSISNSTVGTYSDSSSSTVAYVASVTNGSGHKTSWSLRYNFPVMTGYGLTKQRTIARHEFGHTVGLADLYDTSNNDKLMYGYTSGTATGVTSYDITGAKEAVKP
ncbi:hypothetical protein AWH56_020810 [Anaerobacillus isosaccharinicus]|uniref:Peptidase M10 metallopeptidase domain-containing protein n=2 Tax=Anaerobacillus isosaccharinicus TaxID=1532552 RepID=A0A7S7L643_9BACI|nr:hypothetical protein [Anaerobacillus isosaccharinicus]MBA5586651.1 hypothetical protein [Anaerobacillus isosaccharinicus]QOY35116.1 hypothetical protein AWH56_020810 [Anaerobacillus isosaccharinicus]